MIIKQHNILDYFDRTWSVPKSCSYSVHEDRGAEVIFVDRPGPRFIAPSLARSLPHYHALTSKTSRPSLSSSSSRSSSAAACVRTYPPLTQGLCRSVLRCECVHAYVRSLVYVCSGDMPTAPACLSACQPTFLSS